MLISVSDYIIEFLYKNLCDNIFLVPGGGNMYLVDAVKRHKKIKYTNFFHEQTACIAAEAYSRINNKLGVALVTSGPGATNAITPLAGAYIESLPLIFISGQVKTKDLKKKNIRQNGPQEVNIVEIVSSLTKFSITVKNPKKIKGILTKALYVAKSDRGGPVWIDIPLDIQSSLINCNKKKDFYRVKEHKVKNKINWKNVLKLIYAAKKPLILFGHGTRLSNGANEAKKLIKELKIPFLLTWNSIDLFSSKYEYNFGSPGVVARRSSNIIIQNCDLLISIGSSLNNIITAFNPKNFAKNAKKIVIDNDQHQLQNLRLKNSISFKIDASLFIKNLRKKIKSDKLLCWKKWLNDCKILKKEFHREIYEKTKKQKNINHYYIVKKLSDFFQEGDVITTGSSGLAVEIFYTFFETKDNQRIFLTSGLGSMGYGIAAAIGSCVAKNNKKIFCVESDGSFMFNIQELSTIKSYKLPIKIILLNNHGYSSIRNTQKNYFNSRFVGTGPEDGIVYPNFKKLINSFGISYYKIKNKKNIDKVLKKFRNGNKTSVLEISLNPSETLMPKVSSKVKNGKIISMPLEDMEPYLPIKKLRKYMNNQLSKLSIVSRFK